MPWLGALLAGLLGSSLSRILVGAGLGLVTFAAITPLVLAALTAAKNNFQGLDAYVAAILLKSGMGIALSAIGGALLTRVAIDAGKVAVQKAS